MLEFLDLVSMVEEEPFGFVLLGISLGLLVVGFFNARRWRIQSQQLGEVDSSDVRADIQHRDGCPIDPARMETYPLTREDGITVTVGHCVDCGRMAYRHGDTPIAPLRGDNKGGPEKGRHASLDRIALTRVIGAGRDLTTEADLAGNAADRERCTRSAEDIAVEEDRFLRREKEWMQEAHDVPAEHPDYLDRFTRASYIPSTGSWAVAVRVEAKTKVLSEIRDEL